MTQVRFKIPIDAPAEQVWAVLADFGAVSRYSPTVVHSYLTGDQRAGVGTARHCDLALPGATVDERIVDWRDGERYTLEIFDGDKLPPFRSAHASFDVRAAGPDRTVVAAELAYELKYGPAGTLMDRMMVEPKFRAAFGALVAGLKHHLETGEQVTVETDLAAETAALRTVSPVAA